MAKQTFYAIYQRNKLVVTKAPNGTKIALVLVSKKLATSVAKLRSKQLKKTNTVRKITI